MAEQWIGGFHPVREAMRARPHAIAELLVSAQRGGSRRQELERLADRHSIPLRVLSEKELRRATTAVHNGFAARLREEKEEQAGSGGGDPELVILLEDVQDPRNLGALLRVCEGAGVGRVLIRDRGSAPIGPGATKSAAGATEWLEIERITNSGQSIRALQQQGFWVYGADASGEPPWRRDLTGPLALCFGGESQGLRRRTLELCDAHLGLPMRGRVASLNVATAAAAILFEAVRQRTS